MNNQLLLDVGLARAFVEFSAQKAANSVRSIRPTSARVELFAIEQSRLCDVAPYFDYRAYSKLAPVDSRTFRPISGSSTFSERSTKAM